ncbi:hypothetical protein A2U01_0068876, partial [Trifolium medium]|nr:hypothetical protein [Trifolium medium]
HPYRTHGAEALATHVTRMCRSCGVGAHVTRVTMFLRKGRVTDQDEVPTTCIVELRIELNMI